ncbi:conserved hypothetical protein [Leishmania major strain Friedlin]|uniref:POT family protein n=1 Tax=Leishmania major TaxID=5664 RepID=Q4Q4D4_LEIMA|nr:conserved hypothetical protein [Leishmania major strain Friedlin]CAG9580636.1 POT_family_-_putative [Leishmania major strain Friedlin]CAJ06083.1 conserved hypothetical protein [Leishmania major strain Friedlin]|eukprot:XP_001685814.1 conserved hypothetical protein [Leishmania major strain Friedlin]
MCLFLGLPSSVWALLGIEFVERFGYYAVAFSLFTYCTIMLRTGPAAANALINMVYILVPAAAFLASGVADSRVGRPRVLVTALAVYTASLLLLCVSATPWLYTAFPLNANCGSKALFAVALLGFSAGYGSMKVCTNPIMADCVVLHYRSDLIRLPTIVDAGNGEAEESDSCVAKAADLSTRRIASLPGAAREGVAADAAAKVGEAPRYDASLYGTTTNTGATASLYEEEHVKAALSRLFVYAYWVGNIGGLVGGFVAPLLRNFDSHHLLQGSEEHTTGYYYSFLLAAFSVGLGGAFLYGCVDGLPRNAPAPTFVLVRVTVLALQNRWAVLRGSARIVPDSRGGISDPHDWLDYACVKLQSVSSETRGISAAHQAAPDEAAAASQCSGLAACGPSSSTSVADLGVDAAGTSLWVADCRATLRICKAFIALPIYWLICNQLSTNLMYQAAALDMPLTIPAELFNNINTVTMLLFLVLWDQWLLPRVLRYRVPSACLRILAGFACMYVSMLWCGFLQRTINSRGCYDGEDNYIVREGQRKLSAGWLVMPYILQGFASAFVDPTVMEVAYYDAPERMKGTVMGLYWVASSASGFLGFVLSPVMRPQNAAALFFSFATAQMAVSVLFYIINCSR